MGAMRGVAYECADVLHDIPLSTAHLLDSAASCFGCPAADAGAPLVCVVSSTAMVYAECDW